MKIPGQIWKHGSDQIALVTGTSSIPQDYLIAGQMVELAYLSINREPRDFDCTVRFRSQDVHVDCLNTAAASDNVLGELLGLLDPTSLVTVQEKIAEIVAKLENEQRSREQAAGRIQLEVWQQHPMLAETMRNLNSKWNTDFTFVVFDARASIDSHDGLERRFCISFGRNHTSPARQFLAPSYQPGPVVLALHELMVRGGTEAFAVDCWLDAFPIVPTTDLSTIEAAAKQVLATIDEDTYFRMLKAGRDCERQCDRLTDLFAFTFSDEG